MFVDLLYLHVFAYLGWGGELVGVLSDKAWNRMEWIASYLVQSWYSLMRVI